MVQDIKGSAALGEMFTTLRPIILSIVKIRENLRFIFSPFSSIDKIGRQPPYWL